GKSKLAASVKAKSQHFAVFEFYVPKRCLVEFCQTEIATVKCAINLNSERSLSAKLQALNVQFSYSPFVSVLFRSKVLSCVYVSVIWNGVLLHLPLTGGGLARERISTTKLQAKPTP